MRIYMFLNLIYLYCHSAAVAWTGNYNNLESLNLLTEDYFYMIWVCLPKNSLTSLRLLTFLVKARGFNTFGDSFVVIKTPMSLPSISLSDIIGFECLNKDFTCSYEL